MDQRTKSQPGTPGLGKIFYIHILITRGVSLTPLQQLFRTADWVWGDKQRQIIRQCSPTTVVWFHTHTHIKMPLCDVSIWCESMVFFVFLWCINVDHKVFPPLFNTAEYNHHTGLESLHTEEQLTLMHVRKPVLLFLARCIGFINIMKVLHLNKETGRLVNTFWDHRLN